MNRDEWSYFVRVQKYTTNTLDFNDNLILDECKKKMAAQGRPREPLLIVNLHKLVCQSHAILDHNDRPIRYLGVESLVD